MYSVLIVIRHIVIVLLWEQKPQCELFIAAVVHQRGKCLKADHADLIGRKERN